MNVIAPYRFKLTILFIALIVAYTPGKTEQVDSLKAVLLTQPDSLKLATYYKLYQYYFEIDIDSSKYYAHEMNQLAADKNQIKMLAFSHNALGNVECTQGNYNEGLMHYHKTADYLAANGDSLSSSTVLNNIGNIHMHQGNFVNALDVYLKSLKIAEQYNDTDKISTALLNLSLVAYQQDENENAIAYLQQAEKLLVAAELLEELPRLYNNFALIYDDMGVYRKAIEYYNKSLELSESYYENTNTHTLCYSYSNLGNVYLHLEVYDTAQYYLEKAFLLQQQLNDRQGMAYTYIDMGRIKKNQGQLDSTEHYLQKAMDLSKEISYTEGQKHAYFHLSELYEKQQKFEKSLEYYKQFTILKDSLFNESKSKDIGKLEAKYEFEKQQDEAKRKEELRKQQLERAKSRRDNLQYSGIFIVVLVLFGSVFLTGRFKVSEKIAEGLIFFTFLLFFEFLLVLLDPTIESWSGGEPAYKLVLNAVLAALIFPAHAFFEATLKKRLVKG